MCLVFRPKVHRNRDCASRLKGIGIPYVQDPEVIKLLALLRGQQLCLTQEILNFLMENNCLLMVQTCNKRTSQKSRLGNIIEEIWKLQDWFGACLIRHVPCEHNGLAHTFAYHAWQVSDIVIWETLPKFALSIYWLNFNDHVN